VHAAAARLKWTDSHGPIHPFTKFGRRCVMPDNKHILLALHLASPGPPASGMNGIHNELLVAKPCRPPPPPPAGSAAVCASGCHRKFPEGHADQQPHSLATEYTTDKSCGRLLPPAIVYILKHHELSTEISDGYMNHVCIFSR
jgi:hypothetical protein